MVVLALLYVALSSPHSLTQDESGLYTRARWQGGCSQELDFYLVDTWAPETALWRRTHDLGLVKLAEVVLPDYSAPVHFPKIHVSEDEDSSPDAFLRKTSAEFLRFAHRMLVDHVLCAATEGATHQTLAHQHDHTLSTATIPLSPSRNRRGAADHDSVSSTFSAPAEGPIGVRQSVLRTRPRRLLGAASTPSRCPQWDALSPVEYHVVDEGGDQAPWFVRLRAKECGPALLGYSEEWRRLHKWGNHVFTAAELVRYAAHLEQVALADGGRGADDEVDQVPASSSSGEEEPQEHAAERRRRSGGLSARPGRRTSDLDPKWSDTKARMRRSSPDSAVSWQREFFLRRIPSSEIFARQILACQEQIGHRRGWKQAGNLHCLLHCFESGRVAEILRTLASIVARYDAHGIASGRIFLAKQCCDRIFPPVQATIEGQAVAGYFRGSNRAVELRPVFAVPRAEEFLAPRFRE